MSIDLKVLGITKARSRNEALAFERKQNQSIDWMIIYLEDAKESSLRDTVIY